ncbi:MAG: NAD(P)H-binding protein [Clostridia bacterium]|nr:NAD(P)H-binding protein [Clostridia bacterium]
MKIAVVSAAGKAGRKIVREAKDRGFDVTAFVRKEAEIDGADRITVRNLFDLTKDDLTGYDAVVDAFGVWTPDAIDLIPSATVHLAEVLSGSETRLLVVGGAGSLYVNPEHTETVVDVMPFPEEAMPVVNGHGKALEKLRGFDDVKWTYISPAGDFRADGDKTGKYILGGEELTLNSKGESIISYADYAVAMVDEIEKGAHIRQRISVVSE